MVSSRAVFFSQLTRKALLQIRSTTGQTIIGSVVSTAAGTVISVLIVRALGAEGRGELTAALLWPALLLYIAGCGLTTSVLYNVSGSRKELGVLPTALAISVLQSLVACLAGFFLLPFFLAGQSHYVLTVARIGLLLIPVSLPFLYGLSGLLGRLRMQEFNILRAIVPAATLVVLLGMAALGRVSVAAAVIVPIFVTLAAFTGVLYWCQNAGLLSGKVSMTTARSLLRYGVRAQAGDLGTLATLKLDQILLAALASANTLGLYVISLSLTAAISALTASLRTVVQPRVANASGEDRVRNEVEEGLRRFVAIVTPILSICMIGAPFILPVLFGSASKADGVIVAAEVLLLATFAYGVKEMCAGSLQGIGLPWVVSRTEIAAAAATLVGLLLVIGRAGIVGISLVSLLVYSAHALILALLLKRRVGYRIRACLSRAPAQTPRGSSESHGIGHWRT